MLFIYNTTSSQKKLGLGVSCRVSDSNEKKHDIKITVITFFSLPSLNPIGKLDEYV